jgi:antitoxin (DNA-binding transcriptional repressor) of toxin-antitoxin stability system
LKKIKIIQLRENFQSWLSARAISPVTVGGQIIELLRSNAPCAYVVPMRYAELVKIEAHYSTTSLRKERKKVIAELSKKTKAAAVITVHEANIALIVSPETFQLLDIKNTQYDGDRLSA